MGFSPPDGDKITDKSTDGDEIWLVDTLFMREYLGLQKLGYLQRDVFDVQEKRVDAFQFLWSW